MKLSCFPLSKVPARFQHLIDTAQISVYRLGSGSWAVWPRLDGSGNALRTPKGSSIRVRGRFIGTSSTAALPRKERSEDSTGQPPCEVDVQTPFAKLHSATACRRF